MKKILTVFCFVVILVITIIPAEAAQTVYTITVTGEGIVSATPNQVDIFMTIEAISPSSQRDALQMQAVKTREVLSFLRQEGIDDKDMVTQSYHLGPQYRYDGNTRRKILTGYRAAQTLKVRAPRISGGTIIDGVSQNASVDRIVFVVSNRKDLREAAINSAIADAKAKAQRRASTLGITLGAILGYQEGAHSSPPPEMMKGMMELSSLADAAPELPAGEAEIRSVVSITYELIPPTN